MDLEFDMSAFAESGAGRQSVFINPPGADMNFRDMLGNMQYLCGDPAPGDQGGRDPEPFLEFHVPPSVSNIPIVAAHKFYDHEATVKRYRDYLSGTVQFWNPENQEAFDRAQIEGTKPPGRETGQLRGVHVPADGQSIEQLLEVRDTFRYMGRVHGDAAEKATVGLEPGTSEFSNAYRTWQNSAMSKFLGEFFTAPSQVLPDTVVKTREWLNSLENQTYQSKLTYENLSTFGNMIVDFNDRMSSMFNFGHTTKLALATRLVVLSGLRYVVSMRPSLLVCGSKSSSKTYAFEAMERISCPGMFDRSTYMTIKSMTSDADRNLKIITLDEAAGPIIGQTMKGGDMQQEAIVKSMMTNKEVISKFLHCSDTGRRELMDTVTSRIGTFLLATNEQLREAESATIARYVVWPVDSIPPGEIDSIEKKMYRMSDEERPEIYKMLLTNTKLDCAYFLLVEMAIAASVIRDVNMTAAIAYFDMFNDFMTREGLPLTDGKKKLQSMEIVRILCIWHACYVVFTSPLTESWRVDPVTQKAHPLRQIASRALMEVERRLTISIEESIFGFTLFGSLWSDSEWSKICNTIRNHVVKLDEHLDLEGDGALVHPLVLPQDAASNYETMQKRINHNVELFASGSSNAGVQDFSSAESSAGDRSAPSLCAAGIGREHGDHYETMYAELLENTTQRSRRERELAEFVSMTVKIPFLMPVTRDGEVSVDPQYIEITPQGEYSIKGVSRRIRTMQKHSWTSTENIGRALTEMQSQEIESRVFGYNLRSGKLYVSDKHRDQRVKMAVVKMVSGSSRDVTHPRGVSHHAKRFFIATECLIDNHTIEDTLERAADSMQYNFTMRRTVITGLNVYARSRITNDGREYGERQVFWDLFRTIDLGPKPKDFCLINYNTIDTSADVGICMMKLGVNCSGQALVDLRRRTRKGNQISQFIGFEPDLLFPWMHSNECGYLDEEAELASSFCVSKIVHEVCKNDPDYHLETNFRYPGCKLREKQLKNMELYLAKRNPKAQNHVDVTQNYLQTRTNKNLPKFIVEVTLAENGQAAVDYAIGKNRGFNDETMQLSDGTMLRDVVQNSNSNQFEAFSYRERAMRIAPQNFADSARDLRGNGNSRKRNLSMLDIEEERRKRRAFMELACETADDHDYSHITPSLVENAESGRNAPLVHAPAVARIQAEAQESSSASSRNVYA